ncbi:MAG: type II toxin-antitoxin system Phd/YefM family antitoxin [Gammaproteobacteria bacterium]|nr:type II toxin-antitoxin system Phd/YefM family antitoxin [Gammaproteobacteria bacterium]
MRFITVREIRGQASRIWEILEREKDLVLTNNGKPIAILTATDVASFERSVREIRRARAVEAMASLQQDAAFRGLDKLTMEEIDAEIEAARAGRSAD